MREGKTIAKNSLVLASKDILFRLTSLILTPIIARAVGASILGVFAFAQSFLALIMIWTDLGISKWLVKEVAQNREKAGFYLANGFVLKLMALVSGSLIAGGVTLLLPYPPFTRTLILLVIVTNFLPSLTGIFYSVFGAFEKMEYSSLFAGLSKILTLAVGLYIFLVRKGTIIHYLWGTVIIGAFIFTLTLFFLGKKFKLVDLRIDPAFFRPLLRQSFPFLVGGLFVQVYLYFDSLMLKIMVGDAATGIYYAAYRMMIALHFIPSAVGGALLPTLSKLVGTEKGKFHLGLERAFKYLLMLGLPLAVGTTLTGGRIVHLLFGPRYAASTPVLQILIWTVPFSFVGYPLSSALVADGHVKINARNAGIGTVTNIVTNLIMIPLFSYIGAAITTLFTDCLLVLLTYFAVKKYVGVADLYRRNLRVVGCSVALAIFLYLLSFLNLALLIPASMIFYAGMLLLTGTLDRLDYELLRRALARTVGPEADNR